jgi:hypothetical protein
MRNRQQPTELRRFLGRQPLTPPMRVDIKHNDRLRAMIRFDIYSFTPPTRGFLPRERIILLMLLTLFIC